MVPTQGSSWRYLKLAQSQLLTILSTFGNSLPQNGSKTVPKSQNRPLGYPHIGPFVVNGGPRSSCQKLSCLHSTNLRAVCGADLITSPPQFGGPENSYSPPSGSLNGGIGLAGARAVRGREHHARGRPLRQGTPPPQRKTYLLTTYWYESTPPS